jgi:diguanylate cyclase (GGDEF)-like protein/PAS domain S-box-containing protein
MQNIPFIPAFIRRWLAPPVFDDEDQSRAAALLNTLILSLVALWLGVIMVQIALGVQFSRNIPVALATCALLLAIREIAYRGRVSFATGLFCTILFISLSLAVYNARTVGVTGITVMTICIIVPTLLIGWRMGLVFAALTSTFVFGLSQAEIAGVLPPLMSSSFSPMSQWLVFTVILLFHWALVSAARNSMVEALERARRELAERKRLESSLHWSEQRFRGTLDNIIEGCQIIDREWRYVYVNEPAARQGKHTPDELINHTMMEMYPGIEVTELFKVMHQCMEERVSRHKENEFKFTDGSSGWFDLWIQPAPDGILILSMDITPRKQAQEKLRESESKLRVMLDTMSEGITLNEVVYDENHEMMDYRILEVNKAFYNTADYTGVEVTGSLATQLYGMTPEVIKFFWREHKAENRVQHAEMVSPLNNQAFYISTSPFVDDKFVTSFFNITARKRAEEALRQSEEKFSTFFEKGAFVASLASLPDGVLVEVNEGFERAFGFTKQEAVGKTSEELGINPDSEDRARILAALKEQSSAHDLELVLHAKSGEARIFTVSIDLVDIGNQKYILTTSQDITERKQAEAARAQLQENLHRHNERLAFLHQTTLNLLKQNNMDDLAQAITEEASQLLHADVGYLTLVEGEMLVDRAISPIDLSHQKKTVSLADDQSVMRQVIDSRETFITADFSALPNLKPQISEAELKAGIFLPLLTTDTCQGVLGAGRIQIGNPFSEEDIHLGSLFGKFSSLTLDNTRLHEALRQEAIRDPLTGLFNRRFMQEALARELSRAKRNSHLLAVAMLDLDYFKRINDTFGHDAGDEVLRQLGALLQRRFRGSDVACRYGGEEFTLIIPEVSKADALVRMQELRNDINHLAIQHQGQKLNRLTISIGAAIYPEHGANAETLLKAADEAMYRAKQAGRDQVVSA